MCKFESESPPPDSQRRSPPPPLPPPHLRLPPPPAVSIRVNEAFRVLRHVNVTAAVTLHWPPNAVRLADVTIANLTLPAIRRLQFMWAADGAAYLAQFFACLIEERLPLGAFATQQPPFRVPVALPVTTLADIRRPPMLQAPDDRFYACLFPRCTHPSGVELDPIKLHVLTDHYVPAMAPDDRDVANPNAVVCFPNPELFVLEHPRLSEPERWDAPLPPFEPQQPPPEQ